MLYGCTSLASITIPDSVTEIGDRAFEGCTSLASITIPDSVTEIGVYAFHSCTSLTSIMIPDSVTSIGAYAFYYCTSLASITIPDSVTSIGAYAFHSCTSLTSINIPDGVTEIDDGTFFKCISLTSITIPDSVTEIGGLAFGGCESLASITISNSVISIGSFAFLDTAYYDDDNNWQNDVLYIGNCLISAKRNLTGKYTINAGTHIIADDAFEYCTSLTSITIPDGVTYIGSSAFYYCTSLASITIPKGVTSIGGSAFYNCKSLASITIPDSVTYIGDSAFYYCTSLASITIPYSVTEIGESAFFDTAYYNDINNWQNGVLYIGKCLISAKEDLTGNYAINDGTYIIGDYAFNNCTSIAGITIPESVTSIGNYAFYNCNSLASITIPDSVTYIGHSTFDGCTSLTSITIPDSVTEIGGYAFYGCISLTSVTIPKNITVIDEAAFTNCTNITDVYYGGTRDDFAQIVIEWGNDCLTNANIHYTDSHVHSYDNACDTTCNECDFTRTITHTFGAYVSDKNATTEKDGTKTRTCSVCGKKETVTDVGSKLPAPSVEIKDTSKIFADIEKGSWYQKYVDHTYTYGIFKGTSKTTFSPNDNITRAEFVQVLANLEGINTGNKNTATKFKDVPSGQWFTAAVKWASENGVVNGVGDGRFEPDANVTREQMCVMFVNYAKFKGITFKDVESKATFADDSKLSKWAKTAVYTCQQADIVNGKGANNFDPQGTGTRAEASVLFTKFHKDYLTK